MIRPSDNRKNKNMSQPDSPAADGRNPADDEPEPHTDTLTDLLDRIEREAFQRSLAHRDPPEPAAL
jgi:hypothetical protein